MPRPTILAVDDNRSNLIALEAVLGRDNELVFATSGSEAIRLVQDRADLDLIVMDVQMPEMDGFETAAHIKRLPEGKEIPIVFITAVFSQDPYVKRGYEVGGIDYFNKPFDPEVLRMKVGVYAAFRRRLRESLALRRDTANLALALEGVPVRVLVVGPDGRVTGSNFGDGGDVPEAVRGLLARALDEDEGDLRVRFDQRAADGSLRQYLGAVEKLSGGGAVLLVHDLTAALELEAELEDRIAQLL